MDKLHCYKLVVSASLLMLSSTGFANPPITVTDGTTRVTPSAGITISIPKIHPLVASNGTLTAGSEVVNCGTNHGRAAAVGYIPLNGVGSYSPTTLTGGKTIGALYRGGCVGGTFFVVNGFSSDPGTAWLTSLTCAGTTLQRTNATYSYSGGSSAWHWTTALPINANTSYSCSIDSN